MQVAVLAIISVKAQRDVGSGIHSRVPLTPRKVFLDVLPELLKVLFLHKYSKIIEEVLYKGEQVHDWDGNGWGSFSQLSSINRGMDFHQVLGSMLAFTECVHSGASTPTNVQLFYAVINCCSSNVHVISVQGTTGI